jgi:hypothetical protein
MRAFSPRLYRDAVALVTAADGEDLESFETILADVGAPVARPLADMLVGTLRLYVTRASPRPSLVPVAGRRVTR